jgi:hypothetical protein
MKSDLINVTQLKDVLDLITPTAEEYAEALKKAMEAISEQPLVTYNDPSELLVKESDYPLDATTVVSGTLSLSDICNPTLMALQCKSCGGVIDKDTMTCKHCGMSYMHVSSNEINPRYYYPDF